MPPSSSEELDIPNEMQTKRRRWTCDEDALLIAAVNRFGPRRWDRIAAEVGSRKEWQCRERWNYRLQPGLRKGSWTADEDSLILKEVSSAGRDFKLMERLLPGRSCASIKNRHNTLVKWHRRRHNNHKPVQEAGRVPAPDCGLVLAAPTATATCISFVDHRVNEQSPAVSMPNAPADTCTFGGYTFDLQQVALANALAELIMLQGQVPSQQHAVHFFNDATHLPPTWGEIGQQDAGCAAVYEPLALDPFYLDALFPMA
mmetsp:Transcript_11224/g.33214  ORF Transcript_11224/g.33214 Transcript_11224/m.33214 type:complete len:258 (-) Transcript_11224:341-1114(-)